MLQEKLAFSLSLGAMFIALSCSAPSQKPVFRLGSETQDARPESDKDTADKDTPDTTPTGDSPSELPTTDSPTETPTNPTDNEPEPKPEEDKPTTEIPKPALVWKKADLTNYESYPDPGSEECLEYNGCEWAGMFAALEDKQTEEWVKANNIIAVHEKDFKKYKLKTLRLKKGTSEIDVKVYDMCSDSDCNGCCTKNSKGTGFLIDIEKYTKKRFNNVSDGVIEWACVDCQ